MALPQKKALKEGRTIVFCDRSGFYLLPMVVRTYAPVGQTPILHEHLTRDHLSAMSGITLEGRLYMIEQDRAFKGEDVVRFLKHLMRHIPGKLLVVWDGSPIHRSRAVKGFLAAGAASRVRLEQLPGYAPDLNPDEGVWKHLKCVELKNLCCQSLSELRVELRKAKERLRHSQGCHPWLCQAAGFRGLDVHADINKGEPGGKGRPLPVPPLRARAWRPRRRRWRGRAGGSSPGTNASRPARP
jgi:transposase